MRLMIVVDNSDNETRRKHASVPIANYNALIPPVSVCFTEHDVLRDGYRTASPAGSGLINAVLAVRRRAVKVLLSLVINGDGNDRTEGKESNVHE